MNKLDQFYDEAVVAKYANVSLSFFEFLEITFGEDYEVNKTERHRILQLAMAELGHKNLDMNKLDRSLDYYMYEADLEANPAYLIDCPDFEKYFNGAFD